MRDELGRLGFEQLKTPEQVDAALQESQGAVMLVVNSICGCAAGKARPGVALALQHATRPDKLVTVFAGADIEATERARTYISGYRPSSPSIAIFRNGQLVHMMERHEIEGRDAHEISQELTSAFDRHCARGDAAIS
jgi:putative YphP/YqiW family bacilliredoxin